MPDPVLIIVDLQNDYFEGGRMTLHKTDAAAANAARILAAFRDHAFPVIHIQHIIPETPAPFFEAGTEGVKINAAVAPIIGEPVIVKNHPNSFRDTGLKAALDALGATDLVIVGAMSQMCIDTTTRAAHDMGYGCTVAHDACACPPQSFNGVEVSAPQVHAAFMAALSDGFATVISTDKAIADMG